MIAVGIVREWSEVDGWGVVDSSETPGGCWTHFSHVAVDGYRVLRPGQRVRFEWTAPGQDGFAYRAVRVWPVDTDPVDAYRSTLRLTFDDPPA